jgi:hypothetical protein
VSTTEHRAAQPVRAAVAELTGALSLTTAWLALAVVSVAQLIRIAGGFNGASSEEGLYLTAGLRTWDGEVVDDRLLTQLPGSVLWPALGSLGYEVYGITGARVLALLCFVVAFIALVLGTRNLFGERPAVFCGFALAVSAPFLAVGKLALMESLALAGMSVAFLAITRMMTRDDRLWLLVGSLAMVIATLAQYRAAFFVLPIVLLLLVSRGERGRLDVIVLLLSGTLGFIVYFEAFSEQVEIALQNSSLLTPHVFENVFASETAKHWLILLWGGLPVLLAAIGCYRAQGERRRLACALAIPAALWVAALLIWADPAQLLVFPDLAIGLLPAYPVIGLAIASMSLELAERVALGLVFVLIAMVSWVHVSAFDGSWADYEPLTSELESSMRSGQDLLVNDRWPFALTLYDRGLIDDPAEIFDEESILTNATLLDLCSFEWFVRGDEALAWPPFVETAISSCGSFEQRTAASMPVTGVSDRLRETSGKVMGEVWVNSTPFEDGS